MTTDEISGVDLTERLTALQRPCPSCGSLLVGTWCFSTSIPGGGIPGLVCVECDAIFELGSQEAEA